MKVTAPKAPAGRLPGTGTLAERARQLGQEHAAAGITPFGTAEDVYWENNGEKPLLAALGETGPCTHENFPGRHAARRAYCDALDPAGRRYYPPFMPLERRRQFLAVVEKVLAEHGPALRAFTDGPR